MTSNTPALVSKCNVCLSVMTLDLIIDFQVSIKKGFFHFIICCWLETSSDISPLISMNIGKLWEKTWRFIPSELRPKPKLNTPQHFWRLYSDVGVWFHFPCELILHTTAKILYSFCPSIFFHRLHSLSQSHLSQNCPVVLSGLARNTTLKWEYFKKQTYTSRLFFCLCWGLVVFCLGFFANLHAF